MENERQILVLKIVLGKTCLRARKSVKSSTFPFCLSEFAWIMTRENPDNIDEKTLSFIYNVSSHPSSKHV